MIYSNKPKPITWDKIENVPSQITQLETNGTATSAEKLTTARTIEISGDATGSANFDGSNNVSINIDVINATNATNADTALTALHADTATTADLAKTAEACTGNAVTADLAKTSQDCTGNAATATKLTEAKTIAFTGAVEGSIDFDGSTAITIETKAGVSILQGLSLTNNIATGRKISDINGLVATVSDGIDIIGNKSVYFEANTVTLPALKPSLIYDTIEGTTQLLQADIPYEEIDNNTVGFWVFNKTTVENVPNSAVGISSIAVANDLIPSGTLTQVDGYCDLAIKGDGATGGYVSSNYTGIPIAAANREIDMLITANPTTVNQYLFGMGSSSHYILISCTATNTLGVYFNGSIYDTLYSLTVGKMYLISLTYNGTTARVYVNGTMVYTLDVVLTTTASNFNVFKLLSTAFSSATIHYLEIRNAIRTGSKLGAIANKLLLPCSYVKADISYPIIAVSDKASDYHEWKLDETSGTTVSDTAGTNNGVATGTAIVQSPIGLGMARIFKGIATDKIALGTLTYKPDMTVISVVVPEALVNNGRLFGSTGVNGVMFATSADSVKGVSLYNGASWINSGIIPSIHNANFIAWTIKPDRICFNVNQSYKEVKTVNTATKVAASSIGGVWSAASYFKGIVDYLIVIPRALSQTEIKAYYDSLMSKTYRDITDDILPNNSTVVAYARTNSTEIIEYNDTDYKYGRREESYDGNRKVFLGWQYFSGITNLKWENPFGTRKIKTEFTWAQDTNGTNETSVLNTFYAYNTQSAVNNVYGTNRIGTADSNIALNVNSYGAAVFNNANQTSGYIGCYAEVLENYKGVEV